jgi:hypothetical protein
VLKLLPAGGLQKEVPDSGKDLLTNTTDWSDALVEFLMNFIDGGTVSQCIAAANASFATSKTDPDDRFALVSGKDTMKRAP